MRHPASQLRRIHPPLRRQGPNFVAVPLASKIGYRPTPVKVIVLAATRENFGLAFSGVVELVAEIVEILEGGCGTLLLDCEEFTLP